MRALDLLRVRLEGEPLGGGRDEGEVGGYGVVNLAGQGDSAGGERVVVVVVVVV